MKGHGPNLPLVWEREWQERAAFTFGGHRLSSLYRAPCVTRQSFHLCKNTRILKMILGREARCVHS